jgi:hypothetical protein
MRSSVAGPVLPFLSSRETRFEDIAADAATKTGTQTLTNKTLTSPTLTAPVVSGNMSLGGTLINNLGDAVAATDALNLAQAQAMRMQFKTTTLIDVNTTLTAADAGKLLGIGTNGVVITLPALSAVPQGAVFSFWGGDVGSGTVQRAGSDVIYPHEPTALTSVVIGNGDSLTLVAGPSGWYAIGGSCQLQYSSKFAASLAANGYQKLPGGLLMQWGTTSAVTAGSSLVVSFPLAFPNAALSIVGNAIAVADSGSTVSLGFKILSTSQFQVYDYGTLSAASGIRYIALGY